MEKSLNQLLEWMLLPFATVRYKFRITHKPKDAEKILGDNIDHTIRPVIFTSKPFTGEVRGGQFSLRRLSLIINGPFTKIYGRIIDADSGSIIEVAMDMRQLLLYTSTILFLMLLFGGNQYHYKILLIFIMFYLFSIFHFRYEIDQTRKKLLYVFK